jgi:molybdate transport system substrate-binding protein
MTALLVTGCSTSATSPSAPSVGLTVYAASSLTAAFKDVSAAYQAAHPGTTIALSFDASSALRAQIEQGAPADVFASADTANPQKLADEGLVSGAPTTFAANVLIIVIPASGSSAVRTPPDLASAGVRVIAAGDAVPITKYANQLLANLAKQPGYPADFAAKVTANIASREDNVKAVVAKVELAEGDAAIVYVTDAKASTKLRTIEVPATANVPATYAGVVVKASKNLPAAAAFLAWLTSSAGQAILARYGFLPPP